LLFDDKQIEKALTRPIDWKLPDNYATARRTHNAAAPLAMEDSSIARAIRRMARKACGLPEEDAKGLDSGLLARVRLGLAKARKGHGSHSREDVASTAGSASTLDPSHAKC
jgi:hypothetical protein